MNEVSNFNSLGVVGGVLCIISIGILIYAISGLVRINFFRKGINKQNEAEIDAVKNIDWTELRSKENMENLQKWLMMHINPRLKCPGSAVICPPEALIITGPNKKGKFKLYGHVDSQNEFGALKRAQFTAIAHFDPTGKKWVVEKVSLFE